VRRGKSKPGLTPIVPCKTPPNAVLVTCDIDECMMAESFLDQVHECIGLSALLPKSRHIGTNPVSESDSAIMHSSKLSEGEWWRSHQLL